MKADRYFGAAVVLLALLFLWLGVPTIPEDWRKVTGAGYYTVGPRLFPYVAGSLCLLFGLLVALFPDGRNNLAGMVTREARRNVLRLLGVSVGYVAVLNALGFLISTALALTLFLLAFGERRWWMVGAVALSVPVLIELIFVKLLILELPAGLLAIPW